MFQGLHVCVLGLLIWAFLPFYILFRHLNVPKSILVVNHEIVNSQTTISQTENPKPNCLEVFPFINATTSLKNASDSCDGRYIYIHDLPSRFNKDLVKERKRFNEPCMFANDGFGSALKDTNCVLPDNGWYATDHFNLDYIFHKRMEKYECLTNDSSMATAIFVPFYAGLDASKYFSGYNISVRDAASLDLVDWLQKRDEWKVLNGKDHFLVGGRPSWDYCRWHDKDTDWGNKFLTLPAAKNMSTLSVESSTSNSFAVPYPSYFHPSKDSEVFDWQDKMMKIERKWLFSFAGFARPNDPESIRRLLINQCQNSSGGKYLKILSPSSVMNVFKRSNFCLQPKGDSFTRRSTYDSILAGCIPVFFHQDSFYTQYTWHVKMNYLDYSVFIPEDDIRKNVSIEKRLNRIDPMKIKMMRKEVIDLIPKIIYARYKLESLKDAFDVSVEAIISKVKQLRKH
ncbi:xyloglucan galactosyltransferase MUR3-like [Rutidosis leptorrhynchoides]|uniref:xyloglucan galactosyltransferase MUR3-like n=1 Tax=Rutidosis leptorrhynchoides TaxID=125765 RepID=UPI003A98F4D7